MIEPEENEEIQEIQETSSESTPEPTLQLWKYFKPSSVTAEPEDIDFPKHVDFSRKSELIIAASLNGPRNTP